MRMKLIQDTNKQKSQNNINNLDINEWNKFVEKYEQNARRHWFLVVIRTQCDTR